jgi:hypothetical protein
MRSGAQIQDMTKSRDFYDSLLASNNAVSVSQEGPKATHTKNTGMTTSDPERMRFYIHEDAHLTGASTSMQVLVNKGDGTGVQLSSKHFGRPYREGRVLQNAASKMHVSGKRFKNTRSGTKNRANNGGKVNVVGICSTTPHTSPEHPSKTQERQVNAAPPQHRTNTPSPRADRPGSRGNSRKQVEQSELGEISQRSKNSSEQKRKSASRVPRTPHQEIFCSTSALSARQSAPV